MHAGFTIRQNRGNFIGRKDFLVRTGLLLGAGAFASLGLTPSVVQKFRSKYLVDNGKI